MQRLVSENERLTILPEEVIFSQSPSKIKILDVDKTAKRLKQERKDKGLSMYIYINPLREDRFKNTIQKFSYTKDNETGVHYGICTGFHPDGNPMWQRIEIQEHTTLNLEQEFDCKLWAVIRMSSFVKGSPFATEDTMKYYVLDPEAQAREVVEKASVMSLAIRKAEKLVGHDLVRFGRFLQLFFEPNTTEFIVKSKVIEYAMQDPILFNAKHDIPDRSLREAFYSGLALDVIRHDIGKGHFFNTIPMGPNEETVVQYLKVNAETAANLMKEIELNERVKLDAKKPKESKKNATPESELANAAGTAPNENEF